MESDKVSALGKDARTSRLIILLLAIGFAALLGAAASTFWIQRQTEANADLVSHTLAVEAKLGAFASAVERTETARRGFLLTRDTDFAAAMRRSEATAAAQLDDIDALIQDNPEQRDRVDRLRAHLAAYARYNGAALALGGEARRQMTENFRNDAGLARVRDIRSLVDAMMANETRLLDTREADRRETQSLLNAALAFTGFLILGIAIATLLLVRRNLVDLRQSRTELRLLNEDLEEVVDARTAELKRANAEIQRFAYIVSHDLRSPLVNVMGFTAELDTAREAIAGHFAAGAEKGWGPPDDAARLAVEEDLPEAIGFIRSSTQKMDRLINAILRLSRQGRRTLAPERLDLTALVNGIAESLHHRVQESGTTLTVEPLPEVVNDRVAVEQILSNLVENALKYQQPGRPGVITVSGRTHYNRAIIEVADNGRGIDPRDHDRVFDLFRRSGSQDQPGEGIGLAHARALAYRLGGFLELESALDEGSTFRLILPREWLSGDSND